MKTWTLSLQVPGRPGAETLKSLDAIQADFTEMASRIEADIRNCLPAEDVIDLMTDDQICPSVEWFSLGSLFHAIDAAKEAVDALRTTAAFTSSNVLITWAARKAAEAQTPEKALEALYAFLGLIRRNNGKPRAGNTFGRILALNESTATVFLPELAPHEPLRLPVGVFENFDLRERPNLAKLFAELAADDDEEQEFPTLRPCPGARFCIRIEPSEDGWELMEATSAPPIGWLTVFGLARCILDLDTAKERPAFPAMVRVISKSRDGLWVLVPELDPYPFMMRKFPNGVGVGDLYIAHAQRVQGKRERPENWTVTTRDWRLVQEADVRSSLRSILSVMLVYCEEDRQSAEN